jgi:hypothetical protein
VESNTGNGAGKKLIAQGAEVEFKALIPPRVPDDQNFATANFFKDLNFASVEPFSETGPTNAVRVVIDAFDRVERAANEMTGRTKPRPGYRKLTDFPAWQRAFRQVARDNRPRAEETNAVNEVLNHLRVYQPILDELRMAVQRPCSRFNIDYHRQNPREIPLPHLTRLKWVCKVASLKACAELDAGRPEMALQEIQLIFRIIDAFKSEPFLISYLVRAACVPIAVQPIWEGLAARAWKDDHLTHFQKELSRFDFIADARTVLEAERAVGIATADLFYRHPKMMYEFAKPMGRLTAGLSSEGSTKEETPRCDLDCWIIRLAPRGWWHKEKCSYVELFDQLILGGVDFSKRVIHSGIIRTNHAVFDSQFSSVKSALFNHRFTSNLLLPTVVGTHNHAARAQIEIDQALIACALERHYRAEGVYPVELKACRFLETVPHDIIGGAALKYANTKRFLLYSIGWDEIDDGGQPASSWHSDKGDRVWTYP